MLPRALLLVWISVCVIAGSTESYHPQAASAKAAGLKEPAKLEQFVVSTVLNLPEFEGDGYFSMQHLTLIFDRKVNIPVLSRIKPSELSIIVVFPDPFEANIEEGFYTVDPPALIAAFNIDAENRSVTLTVRKEFKVFMTQHGEFLTITIVESNEPL